MQKNILSNYYFMKKKDIKFIQELKNTRPIVCVTSYSSSVSKILDKYIDIVLIGDSLGTVLYGMKNTRSVSMDMMKNHGRAVTKFSEKAFTVIDMPYNSYSNKKIAYKNALELLKYTKCQAVKLEVGYKDINIVKYLTKNKIKVVSHIGVKPQKFYDFKKIKAVGKKISEKKNLLKLALELENAGSSIILLECVVKRTSKEITNKLEIPTIGIGSSKFCDGQILVIDDLLGLNTNADSPRFIKSYDNLSLRIERALKKYKLEVINKKFPSNKHTYK